MEMKKQKSTISNKRNINRNSKTKDMATDIMIREDTARTNIKIFKRTFMEKKNKEEMLNN